MAKGPRIAFNDSTWPAAGIGPQSKPAHRRVELPLLFASGFRLGRSHCEIDPTYAPDRTRVFCARWPL